MKLSDLAEVAFGEGGPLHQEMQRRDPTASYRQAQAEAAKDMARAIETGYARAGDCRILMRQIGAGIGKSVALPVIAALAVIAHGERVMIAAPDIALRADILGNAEAANRVVRGTCRRLDIPFVEPIRFAERKSYTSFVSARKIADLELQVGEMEESDAVLARRFIEWFHASATHEWTEFANDYGDDAKLPQRWTRQDFVLAIGDEDEPAWAAFEAARTEADAAHVMVLTHAMLLSGGLFGVHVLKSGFDASAEWQFGPLLVDEADKLPAAANGLRIRSVDFADLRRVVGRLAEVPRIGRKAVQAGEAALQELAAVEAFLRNDRLITQNSWSARRGAAVLQALGTMLLADNQHAGLIGRLSGILDQLPAQGAESIRDHVHDALLIFRQIADAGEADPKIGMVVKSSATPERIVLGVEFIDSRWIINSLWRRPRGKAAKELSHSFHTIYMVSATLWGSGSSLIREQIGIRNGDAVVELPDLMPSFGMVTRLIVADRDEQLMPTDVGQDDLLNTKHVAFVATCVAQLAKRGERIAVLVTSHAQRRAIVTALADDLRERVVYGTPGEPLTSAVARYARMEGGIWLGFQGVGVNLVDQTGRTLPKAIVLTRIPIPPLDQLEFVRYGREARAELYESGYRTAVQAIGRGIRNSDDKMELWILDPRWPLPPTACQRLEVNNALGDPDLMQRFATAIRGLPRFPAVVEIGVVNAAGIVRSQKMRL